MITEMPSFSEKVLRDFVRKERAKTINFLRNRYKLGDECEDIFQDSLIVLWQNNIDGKLNDIESSLSTYFIGICKHKAMELLRKNGKNIAIENDIPLAMKEFDEGKCDEIILGFDSEMPLRERKAKLVEQIVRDLPHPCDKLLWGFFRDNLALKTLAEMYNYSLGSVKVIKHRCQEKFRKRYNDLINSLF